MDNKEAKQDRPDDLRRQAEARLAELEEDMEQDLSATDARALLHELQVHQIELEMQNDELVRSRAQVEDALQTYMDLYDFAPIAYMTLDHRGIVTDCNLAAAELLGSTRSEVIASDFRHYLTPHSRQAFVDCLQRALESGQKHSCELRLQRGANPAGYIRLITLVTPGTADRPRQCRVALVDLTDLMAVEDKLRASYDELESRVAARTAELAAAREESERRAAELQAVLASIVDGVMLFDAAGNVTYVNDGCMRIFEVPADESFENWQARITRYTLDGTPLPYEETATYRALHGETVVGFRAKTITPWGKEAIIELTASPIRDPAGNRLGAALVFRDIAGQVSYERRREELLQREQEVSQVLRQALIPPQRDHALGRCRIAVNYKPASEEPSIGGDFYDVFELVDNMIAIVVGDITGKGLQAAFRVGAIRHSIRSYAYLDSSPGKVMTLVNEAMCRGQEDPGEMLTAFYGVIDTATGEITYTCAGHEPPFLLHTGGAVTEPTHTERALGILGGYTFSEAVEQLTDGDTLVVITDGITEAMDERREFFGRTGITRFLRQADGQNPAELASGLLAAATAHARSELRDDAAILVLKFGG